MRLAGLRNWLAQARGVAAAPGRSLSATPARPASGTAAACAAHAEDSENHVSPWTTSRLAIEEELWGSGFLAPGGAEEVARYAAPMGLSAASTVLLIGAGPGGAALSLAGHLGVWVSGHEADHHLAALAQRRIERAGPTVAKRASVQPWSRHAPAFRPRVANHALALGAIQDAPPGPVLAAIAAALKPNGQLSIVELVAPTAIPPTDPAIAAWSALEGRLPSLPQPESITSELAPLGFDVRVVEDISSRHIGLAALGWKHLVRQMALARPDAERAAAVVTEAELWTRRIRLLDAGRIRLMRWHAIGPPRH